MGSSNNNIVLQTQKTDATKQKPGIVKALARKHKHEYTIKKELRDLEKRQKEDKKVMEEMWGVADSALER